MFRFLKNFLFFSIISQPLYADVLVRMEVQQDAVIDYVYLRLYDEAVQDTVVNFLNYVNDGDYDNSFIHRSDPDFVIQGGGFVYNPLDGEFTYNIVDDTYPGGLQEVPEDPAILSEFDKSNVRGTIAMAQSGSDPDSATSQWFINLVDNSSKLDGQLGSFTVFGEVMSDGMVIVDEIASQPVVNRLDIHPAFAELPLVNFMADPVQQGNLVRVNSMTELLSISADIDFKAVIGTSTQSVITIKNVDNISHTIGDIALTDTIDVPFSIMTGTDTCSNTTLVQNAECTLSIEFSPQSEGIFDDTFNIELTDELTRLALSYSFSLRGQGGQTTQDIAPSLETVEFGETQLYDPLNPLSYEQIVVFINNDGGLDLEIFTMSLDGADAAEFEIFENCVDFSPVVPGGYCVLPVNFKPLSLGEKSAAITIVSDDPDENPLVIPVSGTASIDTDGVPAAVEDAAPNGGDGNNDGVLDSIQNNVASFPGINGAYITLITSAGTRISNISVLSNDQLLTPPDNIYFNLGVLDFDLEDVTGGAAEVGVILPPDYAVSTYYKYGPTRDNIIDHWYEFLFDGTTGALLLGNAVIPSPDGTTIERNLIKLYFKDGDRGDADLQENGVINDPGAPVVSRVEDTGSGSISFWLLFYLTAVCTFLRRRCHPA